MQSFKQFLNEEITNHFFKTREEIQEYISYYNHFELGPNNTVNLTVETFEPTGSMLRDGYFPVQFGNVRDYFIRDMELKSLVGSPKLVNNCEIRIGNDMPLTSLIGSPEKVKGVYKVVDFSGKIKLLEGISKEAIVYRNYLHGINSYQNVHKHIGWIGSVIEITEYVKSNILGFALIEGNFSIVCGADANEQLKEAMFILNNSRGEDMLDIQEEMITKGLKEYAKL